MKLYQQFAEKGYHTSLATTFSIDFDAYENVVLSRLRGAGCRNNLVIADGRMLTHALDSHSALPAHAGGRYSVAGVNAGSGVFHPKLFLQVGRKGALLMVGSANLTAAGLAGNLELVARYRCDEDDSGERRLIAHAWRYLKRWLSAEQKYQGDWMSACAPWLDAATPATGAVRLSDGTEGSLLFSSPSEGIGLQFIRLVGAPVMRLVVISPYWDRSLEALTDLSRQLRPERICVLVDPATNAFPTAAAHRLPDLAVYERPTSGAGRFLHAKAILALSEDADHVLVGSANCTWAALGGTTGVGQNAEACVYRRMPPGTALEALDLNGWLAEDRQVDVSTLPPLRDAENIPLGKLHERSPGSFTLRGDRLVWRPTPGLREPQRRNVILVSGTGVDQDSELKHLFSDAQGLHYLVAGAHPPARFARVAAPDLADSALAIVTRIDELKEEVREVGSPRAEALRQRLLLGNDAEATLELLQIINELELSEKNSPTLGQVMSIPREDQPRDHESAPNQAYTRLSYEEFMAHRRSQGEGRHLSTSLAGTNVSLVRDVLNRIVGLETVGSISLGEAEDDAIVTNALDLGDESEAQENVDDSEEPDQEVSINSLTQLSWTTRRATASQIADAVSKFGKTAHAKRQSGEFSATDLLRLRAILMVVCCAGLPPTASNTGPQRSDLQVLPAEGREPTWRRAIGRLLYAIFPGKDSELGLSLSDEHDQLPVDLQECWATCYWCLQACLAVPVTADERIRSRVMSLAARVYRLTMLTHDEMVTGRVKETMDRMSERLAERLGIHPEAIQASHKEMAVRVGNSQR